MDLSIFMAKVLGIYLVILSVPLLVYSQNFISVLTGIFHNASIQFVLGLNVLIIGILMVVSHNHWESSWVVVITILSWLTLIKGIIYTVFPKLVHSMVHRVIQSKIILRLDGLIILALGVFLAYMGFCTA